MLFNQDLNVILHTCHGFLKSFLPPPFNAGVPALAILFKLLQLGIIEYCFSF